MRCLIVAGVVVGWLTGKVHGFVASYRISSSPTSSSEAFVKHGLWPKAASLASPDSEPILSLAIPDPEPFLSYPKPTDKREHPFMPIRSVGRFLKLAFSAILFNIYFVPNIILAGFFVLLQKLGLDYRPKVELGRLGGFKTALRLPPWHQLQFELDRRFTYLPQLLEAVDNLYMLRTHMRTADELIGPTRVPTDEQFISQAILRSPMAYYTKNTHDKLITDMSRLNDISNFPNTYYDVTKIEIDKKTSEISIFTKQMGAIPITNKTAGSLAAWNRTKVHAMTCMAYFIPGIGHSWVHFSFMDVVSAVVHNDLDHDSTLYRLLEPHTRYTNRINSQPLGVNDNLLNGQFAIDATGGNQGSSTQRGVQVSAREPVLMDMPGFDPFTVLSVALPFTSFGFSPPEFIRKNAERTTEYYFRSDEFACPPKWMEGPSAEIPYIKSIKRFYPLLKNHVEKVLKFENFTTVSDFLTAIDNSSEIDVDGYNLNVSRFDAVDVITTILFDAMFIHSTDHYFTYEIFSAAKYGCGTIRHPFPRSWFPGTRIPEDLLDPEDRVRWDGFTKVFVRFNDNTKRSQSILNLKYNFMHNKTELKEVGKHLIDAVKDEQKIMEECGDTYAPIANISCSISY